MDDYLSPKEVAEIVRRLDGVDQEEQNQICKELGIPSGLAWDIMWANGYIWNDTWEKRVPVRRFPRKQA